MPSRERRLDTAIEDYLERLTNKRRAEVTVKGYRWILKKTNRLLEADGYNSYPTSWDEDTVNHVRDLWEETLEPGVMRRQFSILSSYLEFHGNNVIRQMDMEWPQDVRIHVDWLNPNEAQTIMDEAMGLERIILHLELNLGMRRIEVIRLKVQDIKPGYIHIHGKGRQGGKRRTNPFHPDTEAELLNYLELRKQEIGNARPGATIPEELLIYERKGTLYPYQRTAIDNRLKAVSERTGIVFTNHTLRRTFGRTCWLAGIPLETIKELLGHESTKTTILYLGLNMDDKENAMSKLFEYQTSNKRADYLYNGRKSGQSGI